MPEIDYLLITHDHWDHLDQPTVIALQPKIRNVVCGLRVGCHFEHWGYARESIHDFAQAPEAIRHGYDYHPLSRTAFGDTLPPKTKGRVAVVSAGTADSFVAWEAVRTLVYLGVEHQIFEDCGVAGLWRLAERLEEINTCSAVIVVAGLDAALLSVMGGIMPKPIFGVPTSVGYGVAQGGKAKLASMLSSCAPGVARS